MKNPIQMNLLPLSRILSVLLSLGFASALHGQSPQTPLPISGPTTIHSPGYYRLTNNIVSSGLTGNIITIQSHNVVIDFNSFFIIGPSNPASKVTGISANEFGNLTIKNGSIAFCQVGIEFNGNNNPATTRNINQLIENMRITNIYSYGIWFPGSSPGSVVDNCQFSQIGGSTAGTLSGGFGVHGPNTDRTILVRNNIFNRLASSGLGVGILNAFAVRNVISNSDFGVSGGKYQNNLTSNVTTPFSSGVDAGGNN